MIYYTDPDITIRTIAETDPAVIAAEEVAQGWIHATAEKYLKRLEDHRNGISVALIAEYRGQTAGYLNVYWDMDPGPFAGKPFPELVDFGVLEKFRRKGIGTKLMDIAEQLAAERADTVYLGVGLHSGYGSAQRMYVRRGYLPDGSGVWYDDSLAVPYQSYPNDDSLILYFSKKLR